MMARWPEAFVISCHICNVIYKNISLLYLSCILVVTKLVKLKKIKLKIKLCKLWQLVYMTLFV